MSIQANIPQHNFDTNTITLDVTNWTTTQLQKLSHRFPSLFLTYSRIN